MKKNPPSISDLERFDCLKLTERQQLWDALVGDWDVPGELADFVIRKLVAQKVELQRVQKEKADLEAALESQESY